MSTILIDTTFGADLGASRTSKRSPLGHFALLRAHLGAAALDMYVPDWRSKIDRRTLTIQSSKTCVLGQVFGHWDEAPWRLRWAGRLLGFNVFGWGNRGFNRLDSAWRIVLSEV